MALPVSEMPVDTTAPPIEMAAPAAAPATEQPVRPSVRTAELLASQKNPLTR